MQLITCEDNPCSSVWRKKILVQIYDKRQRKLNKKYYNVRVTSAGPSGRRVYGQSLAGIAGSNPAGGMDGCPLWVLCVLFLRRADHSSRGVLPTVVRPRVSFRNLQKEAAQTRKGCKCQAEEEEEEEEDN